jgi:hypothetical protein
MVARHQERIVLSPMNSGCTKPYPHPRGLGTFLPIEEYPYDVWVARRRGREPLVEVAPCVLERGRVHGFEPTGPLPSANPSLRREAHFVLWE